MSLRVFPMLFASLGLVGGLGSRILADEPVTRVYLGTYTQKGSHGIYVLELDPRTGKLTSPRPAAELVNPSFLAFHPRLPVLYAVNEVGGNAPKNSANGVTALLIDDGTGGLTRLNSESAGGPGSCHLCVDQTGKNVLVANYHSGSCCCIPIQSAGSLKPLSTFIVHQGTEPGQKPHAHSATMSPDNRFVVIPDLGLDQLMVYRLDAEQGTLTPNDPPFVKTRSQAGPRHFSFHPNGKFAYNNGERDGTITAYAWDADKGVLAPLMTLSTLPEGFTGKNATAECLVHPSGKVVYVSNRGHDSIAMFRIAADGTLTSLGQASTLGKTPRNFGIDPSGQWMLVANMDSNDVQVFRVDPEQGTLTSIGESVSVSSPCCVRFRQVASGK